MKLLFYLLISSPAAATAGFDHPTKLKGADFV
jgi:hypothetical protein